VYKLAVLEALLVLWGFGRGQGMNKEIQSVLTGCGRSKTGPRSGGRPNPSFAVTALQIPCVIRTGRIAAFRRAFFRGNLIDTFTNTISLQ